MLGGKFIQFSKAFLIMKYLLTLILLGGLASSCDSVSPKRLDCDKEILVDKTLFANAPNDPFDFKDVEIIQNCLKLTIQYGGGCGDIELELIDSEIVMKSNPVQRNIRLSFKDTDPCEAYITKEISFDLTSIQSSEYNQIILNLTNWGESILYSY